MIVAVILTIVCLRWRKADKIEWVGLVFAALFFATGCKEFWLDPFSWPRAFTPLLAALALSGRGFVSWRWLALAAVTLRVGLQFGTQIEGIVRAVLT
jgi:hypothetical protein